MKFLIVFLIAFPLGASGFSCSATCLSKLASAVSIAANSKTIVAGARKLRHPKKKATKSTQAVK